MNDYNVILHPSSTGPAYRMGGTNRQSGLSSVFVRCPDCGQLEWWSEAERIDHGRCRTGLYPCACEDRSDGMNA